MFRGQFIHAIDAKGRVSVPARFRELLLAEGAERFIIAPAPIDPCLGLYPLRVWEEFERRVSELPSLDVHAVRLRRMVVSAAVECDLDRSGRVLVVPHLREKANLDGEVLFAGMGRSVELWAKQRWDAALSMTPEEQQAFQQALTERLRI